MAGTERTAAAAAAVAAVAGKAGLAPGVVVGLDDFRCVNHI